MGLAELTPLGFQFRQVSVELVFWNPLSVVELSGAKSGARA